MKYLIKISEFLIAVGIVILIFKIVPMKFWGGIILFALFIKVVWYMFSTRNLERHGRHFNGS